MSIKCTHCLGELFRRIFQPLFIWQFPFNNVFCCSTFEYVNYISEWNKMWQKMSDKWRTTNWQQCCQHKCSPLSQGTAPPTCLFTKVPSTVPQNMFTFIRSKPTMHCIRLCIPRQRNLWSQHQSYSNTTNRLGGPRLCCPEGTVAVGNLGASNPRGRRTETSPSAAIGWWMAESLQFN